MEWQVVKEIVELFEAQENQLDEWDREWQMDEDQMGIPSPYRPTREEMYKDVAATYNFKHKK